jgi:HlyD family secretion protein
MRRIVAVCALGLAGCGGGGEPGEAPPVAAATELRVVVAPGRVEPHGGVLELGTEVSGRVARILVSAGDSVAEGAPLVELDQGVERARVEQAAAELEAARARWDAAGALVEFTRAALEQAERERGRTESLGATGVATPQELERARTEEATLRADLARGVAEREAEGGARVAAGAAVALARAELERRTIRAPVGGRVLFVGVTPGAILTGFQPVTVVELAPSGPLRVLAEVDELFASRIGVGQRARVVDPAGGGELATGSVTFVAPSLRRKSLLGDAGGEFEDRRVREVHVQLEDPGPILLGARVEIRIELTGGGGPAGPGEGP